MRKLLVGLLMLSLISLLSPAAVGYEAKPLPANSKGLLTGQHNEKGKAALLRDVVDAYREVGVRDPKWDEAAARYLKGGVYWIQDWKDQPTDESLVKDGKALIELGCTDPMVLFFYGKTLWWTKHPAEAQPWLERAVEGLKTVRYPRATAHLVAVNLGRWQLDVHPKEEEAVKPPRALAAQWAAEAAAEVRPGEQRYMLWRLEVGWGTLFYQHWLELAEAVGANPKADPWLVEMLAAQAARDQAWELRGAGFSYTVTEEGWKGFERYLPQARAHATKAWELHPEFPEAATLMIEIAGADGAEEDEDRRWFDRAVAAQFDYLPAYTHYTWYSRPRWGGTHEKMYAFGLECLKTGRYDTQIPLHYLQILDDIDGELHEQSPWWYKPEVYRNLKQMCEGYIQATAKDQDGGRQRRNNISMWASCAWRCGHYEEALKAEAILLKENKEVSDTFNYWFCVPRYIAIQQCRAFSGKQGPAARKAEQRYREGDLAGAIAGFEKVLPKVPKGDARDYLTDHLKIIKLEHRFASGQWVALDPARDRWAWYKVGTWSSAPGGGYRGVQKNGQLYLQSAGSFGYNYDLRGEVDLETAPDAASGLTFFLGMAGDKREDIVRVKLVRGEQKVVVWDPRPGDPREKPAHIRDHNTFVIRFQGKRLTLTVNGERIFDRLPLDLDVPEVPVRLGFGPAASGVTPAPVVLRNLRIRKLPEAPAEEEEPRMPRVKSP